MVIDQQRGLGVTVDKSLKMLSHCVTTIKNANPILRIIRKGTENKTAGIIMPLYECVVQPHLFIVLVTVPQKGYYSIRKSAKKGN